MTSTIFQRIFLLFGAAEHHLRLGVFLVKFRPHNPRRPILPVDSEAPLHDLKSVGAGLQCARDVGKARPLAALEPAGEAEGVE